MIADPRLLASLLAAAAFTIAAMIPPVSAAEIASAPARKAASATPAAKVSTAPSIKKPAAPASIRLASRADPLPNYSACSHLGCQGYFVIGVGF
jgi:hypothetical protein